MATLDPGFDRGLDLRVVGQADGWAALADSAEAVVEMGV